MASLRKCVALLAAVLVAACDPKPTTGSVVVTVAGLPGGVQASVRLTGPGDFAMTVPATQTVNGLPAGEYTVRAQTVNHEGALYESSVTDQTLAVSAGQTATIDVPYALTSGSLMVSFAGLPEGARATVTLRRADGFARAIPAAGIQRGLPPGDYTIHSDTTITDEGDVFGPVAPMQNITVAATPEPAPVTVDFVRTSGTLELTVTGLPSEVLADPIQVNGPGGFSRTTAESETFRGLRPGTYTVSAGTATGECPAMYTTQSGIQSVDMGVGTDAGVTVAYTEGTANDANLNLRIANAHVIQVTQDSAGTVPMIAGRPALLRVYTLANQCNTATPIVRITLSNGKVYDVPAAESSVRALLAPGVLLSTWNVTIPDTAVKDGLTFVAELDPANAVAETDEIDNRFPSVGVEEVDVRAVGTVGIMFVPIVQPNGTGNVTSANQDQFLEFSRQVHPVLGFDVVIRQQPFTSDRSELTPNDGAGWGGLLQDLESARTIQGTQRFFHGIVKTSYSGGIAGIGFIGGKTAITWDHLPSASGIVAHELGHNYGQFHAPCGGPNGPDQNYPYAGGVIGQYGYDLATQTLKGPRAYSDVMGYCDEQWISDYMYRRMLVNLDGRTTLPAVANAEEPVLLVAGRIIDGQPVLDPAFEITARPQPPQSGPHRLVATTADGSVALDISFAGKRIADLPGDNEIFAFTVPVSALGGRTIESLRLTARGRTVQNRMSVAVDADPGMSITRVGPRSARLRWNATRFPVVMVRDPATGDVLSFARGGDATIVTDRDELDVRFSNRVRSARRLLRVGR